MNKGDWWKKEIVYQIYPKSFNDSNGDGIGDINGIISKLDYLENLGITSIWICPIYKSGMFDNGYDIIDYYKIDEKFGTIEELEILIKEAKKRNIKIIMDLVLNHTSREHQWFKEAVKDKSSKYRDYYIIREGNNHKPPNNWRSVFGRSIWEEIGDTNEFYMHTFLREQPDLNWENPNMRNELYEMIDWWSKKGIRGFRLDAVNFIKKSDLHKNGIPNGADGLCSPFRFTREIDGIEKFFQELSDRTFKVYDFLTVTEAVGVSEKGLEKYARNFSMMFNFDYTDIDIIDEDYYKLSGWTKKDFKKMFINSLTNLPYDLWQGQFIENHDQPRFINKMINNKEEINYYSKTMFGAMYFFTKGTPFIYQGQEIGMENCPRNSIEEYNDVSSKSQHYRAVEDGYTKTEALKFIQRRSRDNARTPMQWNKADNAGFSSSKPWMKVNENYININVEDELKNEKSVLNFYKKMINLRKSKEYEMVLVQGGFKEIEIENDEIIAYKRFDGRKTIEVYCNFSNNEKQIDLKDGKAILNNYERLYENKLLPYQAVLIEKEGLL